MTFPKRFWFWLFLALLFFVPGCGNDAAQNCSSDEDQVVAHIRQYGKLPDCYITKQEARRLGWDPQKGNLDEVAPGKAIGGDVFHNREGKLPDKPGRVWYEADIHYSGGHRGGERIVFSNDGLIYITRDHYKTFQKVP